jgi:hypothetical protein
MWKKKEKKKEEKEESLLKELCGDDAELYDFLARAHLYLDPIAAISKKDLEILIEEAEKSIKDKNYEEARRKYILTVDKAIFEATQNPGERDRYIKLIQDLASKACMYEKLQKEGSADYASSLEGSIKNYEFMSERIEDVLRIASLFYNERLEELGAGEKREARRGERRDAEREDRREEEIREKEAREKREARRGERKGMGRGERRDAEREDRREEEIREKEEREKREARRGERRDAEREEERMEEEERERREAKRKAR